MTWLAETSLNILHESSCTRCAEIYIHTYYQRDLDNSRVDLVIDYIMLVYLPMYKAIVLRCALLFRCIVLI